MRTVVIIEKEKGGLDGYRSTTSSGGSGHCGDTPVEAAAKAAKLMLRYARRNPEGGDLMAPPEVLELVPPHLHTIEPGQKQEEN